MIVPARADYQLAEQQQAISCGGIAAMLELIKRVGLREQINRAVSLLKFHAPYDEADHMFNIALNLLAGGTCLDHLQLRPNENAYFISVWMVLKSCSNWQFWRFQPSSATMPTGRLSRQFQAVKSPLLAHCCWGNAENGRQPELGIEKPDYGRTVTLGLRIP